MPSPSSEGILTGGVSLSCCVDVFSQVSDSHGVLVLSKFDSFLREVLKLPTAVLEGPAFGYTNTAARSCFPQQVWHSVVWAYSVNWFDFLKFSFCFIFFWWTETSDAEPVLGHRSRASSVSHLVAFDASSGQRGAWYTHSLTPPHTHMDTQIHTLTQMCTHINTGTHMNTHVHKEYKYRFLYH